MSPETSKTNGHHSILSHAIAVRMLALVAAMLLVHSVLMLDPADAHGGSPGAMTHRPAAMTMPGHSDSGMGGDHLTGLPAALPDHPAPPPDDRDCGVVLPAVMPGGPVMLPATLDCPLAVVPEGTLSAGTDVIVQAGQDGPSQDPRRKRAVLQIWRV